MNIGFAESMNYLRELRRILNEGSKIYLDLRNNYLDGEVEYKYYVEKIDEYENYGMIFINR